MVPLRLDSLDCDPPSDFLTTAGMEHRPEPAMTLAVLFGRHGLRPNGPVAWNELIPCDLAGVYAVTMSPDPTSVELFQAPIQLPRGLCERWPGSSILYIGKAGGQGRKSTLRKRINQFYRHHYGAPSPHRGGQDVLLVQRYQPLWVYWSPTLEEPRLKERKMIEDFVAAFGHKPFANRQN
jgi:hypothetical protein